MKCQARANLWWPSSNTSGPPPECSGRCRQAMALAGTSHAVSLRPGLLLMRMESGVPIASVRDQLPGPDDRGVEQEVLEYLERALRGVGGGNQAVGLLQRDAHRLLERDDLAGVDGLQCRSQMQVMGQQDLDKIDVRAGEQGVDVALDGNVVQAPGRRPLRRARRVHIAERHDPRQRAGQILDGVQIGDPARAHDADSDGAGLSPHVSPGS